VQRSRLTITALATTSLLLAACGSDDAGGSSTGGGTDGPLVVATTSIWADVTSNVACDGLARVETVIPRGADPHSFEPSLRDRATLDDADLVIANGLDLEESLTDTVDAVESAGVPVLRIGEELDPLPVGDSEHDTDTDADTDTDHGHGGDDPHVWWDPTRVATAVPVIADALVEVGLDRERVDVCAARYVDELARLDDDVAAIVATLPTDERILVTNHDSLGYFADRYGFEVIGTVIPSSSSLAAPSASELDDLAEKIQATGVPAIFADTQNSSADADALAKRLGDVEVVSLLTGTLDEPGTDAGTYVGWLRSNATMIVDALGEVG
jgi:zinc/manganese transport system substrate-binding protein